jgi:hypothetical protein
MFQSVISRGSLGVIAGGGSVVLGIALLAAVV